MPTDRFVWAYAGNLGLYHGLDTAMDAAELLGDDFQLLLIGHGSPPRRARAAGGGDAPGAGSPGGTDVAG